MANRFDCVDFIDDIRLKRNRIIMAVIALAVVAALLICFLWPRKYRSISVIGSSTGVEYPDTMSTSGSITTGPLGDYRELFLDENKYIYVEEDTRIDYELSGRDSSSVTNIYLDYGSIITEFTSPLHIGESFRVISGRAVITASDACFRVSSYTGSDGLHYIRTIVLEGEAQCSLIFEGMTPPEIKYSVKAGREALMYEDINVKDAGFVRFNSMGENPSHTRGDYTRDIDFSELSPQSIQYTYKNLESGKDYWYIKDTKEDTYYTDDAVTEDIKNAPEADKSNEPKESEKPQAPEVHEKPEKPQVPEVHDKPEEPQTPEVHDEPEEPQAPEVHDEPEEPQAPEVHDEPEEPQAPEVHDEPEEPQAPEVHDKPEEPKEPEYTNDFEADDIQETGEPPEDELVSTDSFSPNDYSGIQEALENGRDVVVAVEEGTDPSTFNLNYILIPEGRTVTFESSVNPVYTVDSLHGSLRGNILNHSGKPLMINGSGQIYLSGNISGGLKINLTSGQVILGTSNSLGISGGFAVSSSSDCIIGGSVTIISPVEEDEDGNSYACSIYVDDEKSTIENGQITLPGGAILYAYPGESKFSSYPPSGSSATNTDDSPEDIPEEVPQQPAATEDAALVGTKRRKDDAIAPVKIDAFLPVCDIPDSGEGPKPGTGGDGSKIEPNGIPAGSPPDPVVHFAGNLEGILESLENDEDIIIVPDPDQDVNTFDIGVINIRPGQTVTISKGVKGFHTGISTINGTLIHKDDTPITISGYLRINGCLIGDIIIEHGGRVEIPYGGSLTGDTKNNGGILNLRGILTNS